MACANAATNLCGSASTSSAPWSCQCGMPRLPRGGARHRFPLGAHSVAERPAGGAVAVCAGKHNKHLGTTQATPRGAVAVATTAPVSMLDVDPELWAVLDLCNDDELESLYAMLHASSPFSPVVKSLVRQQEPAMLQLRGRASIMHKIEYRFRFLAASSTATIRGQWPSYREALLALRDRLGVECSSNLSTPDLETELFVHILHHCLDSVVTASDPDPTAAAEAAFVAEGDGMGSSDGGGAHARAPRGNWTERLTAPLRFGLHDLLGPLFKLGGAATVSAVGRSAAERLAAQLVCQHARYQATAAAATRAAAAGASGALAAWQRQAALSAAQRGVTSAAARYAALRGALAWVGPLLWGWAALDVALAALGTDYARLTRAVFVLAQVRLVATQGFTNQGAPPLQPGG